MRVLHVDDMFHPSFGYQVNLLSRYEVEEGNEVYIMACQKDVIHPSIQGFADAGADIDDLDREFSEKYKVHIIRPAAYGYFFGRCFLKHGYAKTIKEIKPDVVFLHQAGSLTAIRYLLKGLYKTYPTVLDTHMLEMATVRKGVKVYNFFYRNTISKIINNNNLITIRTQDDDYINRVHGVNKDITPFISFGSDTLLFHPDAAQRNAFRRENSISENAFVIIYAGKLSKDKDGVFLANVLKKKLISGKRDIVFVIVGNIPPTEYGKQVKEILDVTENRVLRFPTQNYVDLPKFFQASDLFIIPKQCSLTFYDTQACGLPMLAEDNNINTDRVSHGNGFTFISGNADDFKDKMLLCAEMDDGEYAQMKENAKSFVFSYYNYRDISEQYTVYLKSEYENFIKRREG